MPTSPAPAVILIDGDYLDSVAFDLIVNFERIIGRRIPQADFCHWLNCIALDGGLRPGDNRVQVHILHTKEKSNLANFRPSSYHEDLDGLTFSDGIGRFEVSAFPVEEVTTMEDFFRQSLTLLADTAEINRLMVIGDMNAYGTKLKQVCSDTDGKEITLFAMEPTAGRGFQSEILGYSLMSALGIRADEI